MFNNDSSIIQFVCIIISFFTTDRVGRRPLLLGAVLVMCLSLLGVGVGGSITRQTTATHNSLLALSCIWMAAYSSGLAPVGELTEAVHVNYLLANDTVFKGSIYQGEASTARLRAKTNSIS